MGTRTGLILLAVALAGCAHVEPPAGGPEDRTPPELVVTRPDSLRVAEGWRGPVAFAFDERISERGIDEAVSVSPRTSPVIVRHRGSELRVDLREGWRPGTIYHVTVSTEVRDLFGNQREEPIRLVFSTGPEIPENAIAGVAVDRITGNPETELRVEAIRAADSLVYTSPTDTAGRFLVPRIPPGEYEVRGYRDLNRNRALDEFEARDVQSVTLGAVDSVTLDLQILEPDTTPPRITSARITGQRIEVEFDDYLDPDQEPRMLVQDADSNFISIERVGIGELPPEPGDTAAEAEPRRPSQRVIIQLFEGIELEPGAEYRVLARGIRNVAGLTADAETLVRAPEAQGDTGSASDRPAPSGQAQPRARPQRPMP